MSYEVHIARKPAMDAEGALITRPEWEALVAADPDLELAAGGGPSAIWIGHPEHRAGRDKEGVLLLFSEWGGYVSVDAVAEDEASLRKLVAIAEALGGGAALRGDDGTIFEVEEDGLRRRRGGPRFARGVEPSGEGSAAAGPGLRARFKAGLLRRLKR